MTLFLARGLVRWPHDLYVVLLGQRLADAHGGLFVLASGRKPLRQLLDVPLEPRRGHHYEHPGRRWALVPERVLEPLGHVEESPGGSVDRSFAHLEAESSFQDVERLVRYPVDVQRRARHARCGHPLDERIRAVRPPEHQGYLVAGQPDGCAFAWQKHEASFIHRHGPSSGLPGGYLPSTTRLYPSEGANGTPNASPAGQTPHHEVRQRNVDESLACRTQPLIVLTHPAILA